MIELFKLTDNKINLVQAGLPTPNADIDFFLRPPPWNVGRSRRKIAYFYWEAIPLPEPWAACLNSVDEVWAPCNLVSDCCKMAGFKGKIHIIPTPATNVDFSKVPEMEIPGVTQDFFKFYSISQWHNRKGWVELLTAFFEEFSSDDKVCLIIKTNPINPLMQNQITEDVRIIRSKFSSKATAPLFLIPTIISEAQLLSIHKSAHCYVAPHHGEGWGMPIHDAILAGKQVIATKFGGVVDFLDDEAFHPIPFSMVPVSGMEWNGAYSPTQKWAQPDIVALKSIMRDVFTNHKSYIKKNILMQKSINKLSFDGILEQVKGII
jgi:glycosyltransferase involved in cell wall biosynthesis